MELWFIRFVYIIQKLSQFFTDIIGISEARSFHYYNTPI